MMDDDDNDGQLWTIMDNTGMRMNLENLCYTCLKEDNNLTPLSSTFLQESKRIKEMLLLCVKIKVEVYNLNYE